MRPKRACRRGFAVPAVVFLLFAIGVAAVTGYRVIQTEAKLSLYMVDAGKALAIAQGGLWRQMATTGVTPSDTAVFSIGGGEAVVSGRRVRRNGFPHETWVLTSRSRYSDPRFADVTAERMVRHFAIYRRAPLNLLATFANTGTITVSGGVVSGVDTGSLLTCPEAPQPAIASTYQPQVGRSAQDVLDGLDVLWDVLTDPSFPVDYSNVLSPAGLPADYYPVVRIDGNLSPSGLNQRRGILIVTGELNLTNAFRWDGIILAGRLGPVQGNPNLSVRGVLAAGFGGVPTNVTVTGGSLTYNSCEVLRAGRTVAMLRPVEGTWMEVFDH